MFFEEVPEAPADPVFGLNDAFLADSRSNKVNLIIGIYKNDALEAKLMDSVRKAKHQILSQDLAADYLPIEGLSQYCQEVGRLAFGENRWLKDQGRIYAAQSVGGAGALQVAAQFLYKEISRKVALPMQTWVNHQAIFDRVGFENLTYPYYDREKHEVDFEALLARIEKMDEKTILLLHPNCHNPTGADLSVVQWKELSRLMLKKKIFPLFDFAYQGFGEGIEKDREAIDVFMDDGHEMMIAYSCSKNFSLYCQRVGALFVVSKDATARQRVGSQVKRIIRSLYSNPPAHGARIVSALLEDPNLRQEWTEELGFMRKRIQKIREKLAIKLTNESPNIDFGFLKRGKGMFSLLDLNKNQVKTLVDQFGIYLSGSGRISLAAISEANIDYVANHIALVYKK